MNVHETKVWDVIVVGGGPAGMIAAGRAGERGFTVLLLEKNDTLGKKLLLTGGGRSNITNAEFDVRKFLAKFSGSDKFLFSAFSQFGVQESLDFFHGRGMQTKIEEEQRVFPKSNTAQSVWDALVSYMSAHHVVVRSHTPVLGLRTESGKVVGVEVAGGEFLLARSIVLATGGLSRPDTGSTGDGFRWLKEIGHTIADQDAALVPLSIKESWVKELQGVSLSFVKLSVFVDKEKHIVKKGKILFTHFGVSGPLILNLSREVGQLLPQGSVTLSLDLLPDIDPGMLNEKLTQVLRGDSNKLCKNLLAELLPGALVGVLMEKAAIDLQTPAHSVTREQRLRLVEVIKGLPITVSGLLGKERAVVTSGGVVLEEVDFKTMRSRIHPNVYITGDLLNIDRPTGGYSLQLCWTTGWVAGNTVS